MTFERKLWEERQKVKLESAKKMALSLLGKSLSVEDISELLIATFDFSKQEAEALVGEIALSIS